MIQQQHSPHLHLIIQKITIYSVDFTIIHTDIDLSEVVENTEYIDDESLCVI
jgi:hypothetical protein